jgi:hypothetical protein
MRDLVAAILADAWNIVLAIRDGWRAGALPPYPDDTDTRRIRWTRTPPSR